MYSNSMDIEILDVSSCVILRSFPFCICFTCFKCKDFDSERSPRSYKKCLGRDLLASRAPPQCSPSLSLSLFQNQCMSAGQTAFFQKLHTSGSGAKVSWVIMSHRNKMNKQQTTSYLQKVLSCTRSVESSVSNVGQADPRQAQGCIKGSLPTSRQIQHSRAWRGRRLNKNGGLLVSIRGSMMVLPTCLSVFVQQFYNFTSTSMRLEKQTIFLVAQLHSFRWTGQNIYKI